MVITIFGAMKTTDSNDGCVDIGSSGDVQDGSLQTFKVQIVVLVCDDDDVTSHLLQEEHTQIAQEESTHHPSRSGHRFIPEVMESKTVRSSRHNQECLFCQHDQGRIPGH